MLLQLLVNYAATCGTITAGGAYTGPSSGGPCLIIASSGAKADTATARFLVNVVTRSAPFGFLQMGVPADPRPFTLTTDFNGVGDIVADIGAARNAGLSVVLSLPCGAHSAANPGYCLSTINGVLQFDRTKFDARLALYGTAAIRQAVQSGLNDGTIIGVNVLDEPYTAGAGDGNTWGPPGTMTKARVDSLCRVAKDMFPGLPAGSAHQHQLFQPTLNYQVCDLFLDQYGMQYGNLQTWMSAGLAIANRQHTAIMFSMNVLNGGVQDADAKTGGVWDCPGRGKGTYSPNCRMLPSEVETFGKQMLAQGCALLMWRFDVGFAADPANQLAFRSVADSAAKLTRKECRRW